MGPFKIPRRPVFIFIPLTDMFSSSMGKHKKSQDAGHGLPLKPLYMTNAMNEELPNHFGKNSWVSFQNP